MTDIQGAMCSLISAFQKYSGKEGDDRTLTKNELKELLNNEMKGLLSKPNDKAAIDKIFNDLDANGDQTVDFKEYICLIACITCECHEYFSQAKK
ncbi:protein S100-P-like [Genypterus blacodes]|uniref:protein S100-P-like n=1 Tax=Genypterus blacodes TaxID=154954 RepID=UPI003F7714CD